MTTRKQYSQEFKLDAVSLVLEQGYSRAAASRNLEVNPNLTGRWVKEYQKQDMLQYISMFYNSTRMHSYLAYKNPNQFEKDNLESRKAA